MSKAAPLRARTAKTPGLQVTCGTHGSSGALPAATHSRASQGEPAPVCIDSMCYPCCLQGPNGPVAQAVLAWQDTLSPRSKGSSRRGSLMVRELTLHQLNALIEDVYASKRRADAR